MKRKEIATELEEIEEPEDSSNKYEKRKKGIINWKTVASAFVLITVILAVQYVNLRKTEPMVDPYKTEIEDLQLSPVTKEDTVQFPDLTGQSVISCTFDYDARASPHTEPWIFTDHQDWNTIPELREHIHGSPGTNEEYILSMMALYSDMKLFLASIDVHDYWIQAGGLIGTIRIESFLPWDGDLDFSTMPYEYHKINAWVKSQPFVHKTHGKDHNKKNYCGLPHQCLLTKIPGYENLFITIIDDKNPSMWKDSKDEFFHGIHFNFFDKKSKIFAEFWVTNYSDERKTHLDANAYGECDWHRDGPNVQISDIFPLRNLKFANSMIQAPRNPMAIAEKFYFGEVQSGRIKTNLQKFGSCVRYQRCTIADKLSTIINPGGKFYFLLEEEEKRWIKYLPYVLTCEEDGRVENIYGTYWAKDLTLEREKHKKLNY